MVEMVCSPVRIGNSQPTFAACSVVPECWSAPLASLAESDLTGRFRHWHGVSGRRYLFSIFSVGDLAALDQCPRYEDTILLAVIRAEDGSRTVALAAPTGPLPDLVFEGEALRAAVAAGVNEIHMHLLARDEASRDAVMRDIAG